MYTPDDAYLIAGGAAKYFLVHDASNPLVYYKINAHNGIFLLSFIIINEPPPNRLGFHDRA